jgi:hypothetical protein
VEARGLAIALLLFSGEIFRGTSRNCGGPEKMTRRNRGGRKKDEDWGWKDDKPRRNRPDEEGEEPETDEEEWDEEEFDEEEFDEDEEEEEEEM